MWVNTLIGVVLTAYVDESMRRRRGEGVCVYVLAAVLVDDSDLDDVRDELRLLRKGKSKSIHWRYEQADRQPMPAAAIASSPIRPVVSVCLHELGVAGERVRRLCLASLLAAVSDHNVARAILDSRREQDDNDLKVLQAWRRAGRAQMCAWTFKILKPNPRCGRPTVWLTQWPGG